MEPREDNRYSDLLTPVVCDGCAEENDVINYCLQCNANICSRCKHTHGDTRLTKGHIVLHRTHSEVIKARFSKRVYCPNHTGKEYVTYCVVCRQPCCATCISEKHGGHAFSDLETILLQTESEVAELVRDVETNLIPLSKDALIMLEEEKASYKRVMEDVKLSSEEILRQHTQQLSKTQEVFLTEVDTLGENDLKYMEGKKQELEQNLENVKSVVLKGKTAPVDASIFHLRDDLVEASALKPRQITCPGNLSFHMTSFQLSSGPDAIGSISNDTEKILFNLNVQDQEGVSNEGGLDARYVKPMILKTINGIFAKFVICTHNNDVLIFNEDDKSIALYDADSITKTKTINVGFYCYSMALHGAHDFIALDWDNKHIMRIYSSGSVDTHCETIKRGRMIYANNQQEIVVGVPKDETVRPCIWKFLVCSSDGSSILREISHDKLFTGYLSTPQVKQTASGEYVVTIDNRVLCFSTEWEHKWTHNIGPHYYLLVGGLYCDRYNNILVGNTSENKIVMLNIFGKLVRTLLTEEDGICNPWSMDVDKRGRLWIGQEKNVLVFTYLKQ